METMVEIEEKWICPNCGEKMEHSSDISTNIYICPECGCSIDAEDKNFDSNGTCPNCNQVLDNSNECPYCGYDLGTDFD